MLAELQEESIPAQDLAAPSPAAATSPGAAAASRTLGPTSDTNSDSGEWTAGTCRERRAPAGSASAGLQPDATSDAGASPSTPAEIAPAIDVGSIATTPQISDSSLAPLIASAPTPARAASLRITEQRTRRARARAYRRRDSRAGACDLDRPEQLVRVLLSGPRVHRAQGLRAGADVFQARGNRSRVEFRVARRDLRVRGRVPRAGGQVRRCGRGLSEGARGKSGQPDGARRRHAAVRVHAASASASAPAADADQAAPREPEAPPPPDEAASPAAARICARLRQQTERRC